MKRESKMNGIFLCIIVTTLFLAGCINAYSFRYGPQIKEDIVKMIQPGKTTKEDIIQWFGSSTNIVQKQGADATTPKEGLVDVIDPRLVSPSFDLFSSKHKITEDHRIYVYTSTKSEGTVFYLSFFTKSDGQMFKDSLLVLVNEKTGIAEDYIFIKENK